MEEIKDLIIHKPNELIEVVGNPISVLGLLTYNFLLHRFQKEKKDKLIISPAEIFEALNITDNYDDLYSYLDSLLNVKIVSIDKKGKAWGAFHLLSEYKKLDRGIFVQIPDTIFRALCNTENEKTLYYTTIKLLEQRVYRCSYTIVFYELFKKYEKINLPLFNLKELKQITNTQEKYTSYYDFKRYVLLKALKEINQFDKNFQYNFTEELVGKKVERIKFIKTEKNKEDLAQIEKSEKMEKAIKKARKNKFVDSSYSEKAMEKIIQKYDEKDIIKALGEITKYNTEIINFSKFLTAKITDIVKSKKTNNIQNIKDIINNVATSNTLEVNKNLILISEEDYEELYKIYLKENNIPDLKSVRIGFDMMNSNKFKIISKGD